jgi:hypothetical protein
LVAGIARALAASSEQVGDVLGDLARALDGLLGGGDGTLKPAEGGIVQLLAVFSDQLDGLAQEIGAAPNPDGSPIVPPDAPIPVSPGSPGGSPGGGSFFSGASAGSGNAFVPLFGAVALLSLSLMRGGKPWWLRGERLKPKSALRLAIERPG